MIKILKFLKPYWLPIIALIAFTSAQVWVNLQLPDYLAKIINQGIVQSNQDLVITTGVHMLLIALAGGIFTVISGYLSAKIGMGFSRDMRETLFTKVEDFSLAEFNKFSTSSLITRSTNDVQQVQMVLIMVFRLVLSAPITAVGAILKAIHIAPSMSWIMALAVVLLLTVITILFSFAIPKFQLIQKLTDKLNLVARESLTGIRVIRAFDNEKIEEEKFLGVNNDLMKTNLFVVRAMSFMQPVMFLIMNLTTIAIIWFGAHLIESNKLEIGNMLAFMQYSLQVIFAFLMISIVFIMIPRALVSARRVIEVLDTDSSIQDPNETKGLPEKKGLVEFRDVTFAYNHAETPILENISFTAKPGEITAFIGSTGSGKSTVINLIPRFYDATFGQVLVDGVDIKDLAQHELRDLIGYIPQKAVIFSGTIRDNIKYGAPQATDEAMVHAAEIAQAADFINNLPEKYETQVSQDGTNLSGGQKQRVSIARAVLKDPQIFIFDDSFSALDFRTDAKLREALFKETKDKTVLIVAQRINTIVNADQIIVLDKGHIVGIGKHNELMETCDIYKEIAYSQLSEEELEHSTHMKGVNNG